MIPNKDQNVSPKQDKMKIFSGINRVIEIFQEINQGKKILSRTYQGLEIFQEINQEMEQ